MLAVKGIYKKGKIELLEPLEDLRSADLYIVVIPHESEETGSSDRRDTKTRIKLRPEDAFMQIGLERFSQAHDDETVDWEESFGLKDR